MARLKISNFNKHLNSLKIDIIDNGSRLHLNKHEEVKLVVNLIKKLRELRGKKI